MQTRRRFLLAAGAALTTGVAAACSTGPAGESGSGSATATAGQTGTEQRSVTHAFGTTSVPASPRRIATVGWTDHEVVAALGMVPVGATKITWGGTDGGSTTWFDEAVKGIDANAKVTRYDEADGIAVDEIAKLSPDLILGVSSGMSREEYTKLSSLAPTVAYPKAPWSTGWEEQLEIIGQALGLEDKASEVKAATDKTIDDALAAHPALAGKTVAWAWFTPTDLSTIGLYTTTDIRPQMLRRFGMKDSPTVVSLSKPGQFSANLSAEKAASLNADVLVFVTDGMKAETVTDHRLLSTIPAITAGRYVASADNVVNLTMSSPTPLSIPVAAQEFVPMLAKAAQGTPAT